jgi:predicted amidohydrolase YtcJ
MGGWSPYQLIEKRMPTVAELNRVAPRVPVLVLFGYSQVLLNRAGAEALGFPAASALPGGHHERTDGGDSLAISPSSQPEADSPVLARTKLGP